MPKIIKAKHYNVSMHVATSESFDAIYEYLTRKYDQVEFSHRPIDALNFDVGGMLKLTPRLRIGSLEFYPQHGPYLSIALNRPLIRSSVDVVRFQLNSMTLPQSLGVVTTAEYENLLVDSTQYADQIDEFYEHPDRKHLFDGTPITVIGE